jgi:hypothetical protein
VAEDEVEELIAKDTDNDDDNGDGVDYLVLIDATAGTGC